MAEIAISIIIPAYNRLWSLPETIESCRNNSCAVEIIVIDDGSTDGTWEWLKLQKNITIVRQSNLGKCWAINKGFELASGKYIRFLDSDDLLIRNANDEQYSIAIEGDPDIIVSGYKTVGSHGQLINTHPWIPCDDFIAQQLGECDGSHYSAFIFKKTFLNDIPHRPDFAFRDDRLFILEAALKRPLVKIHHGFSLLHRMHLNDRLQTNQGIKQSVQNYQHYLIYKRILTDLEDSGKLTDRYKKASANVLWHLAHWMAKTHIDDAENIYKWVYKLDPGFTPVENFRLARLYKKFGFRNTEIMLRIKNSLIR
jgi:glycosyltransferase involved in cell wall biosynthesis